MIIIFLALMLIYDRTTAENEPYFVITPKKEKILKKIDKELNPRIACFEFKAKFNKNKSAECDGIIQIFSDSIRHYHAQASWEKYEKQNRFCTLDDVRYFAEQKEAEENYQDALRRDFKHLNLMHPFMQQACSDESAKKTVNWYMFQQFKNAVEQCATDIVKSEQFINPLPEDLCSFQDGLLRATKTSQGKVLICKQKEEQQYTLEKIQNGTRDGWEALNHDYSIGKLVTELAMLDPISKKFYEKHVLHTEKSIPIYHFEPIHKTICPVLEIHNIGQIRKVHDSWKIIPLNYGSISHLATLKQDGSLEPCLDA